MQTLSDTMIVYRQSQSLSDTMQEIKGTLRDTMTEITGTLRHYQRHNGRYYNHSQETLRDTMTEITSTIRDVMQEIAVTL